MEKESQQRRVRTKFTAEQINKLEKIFSEHRYLDARERMRTAKKLGLTETQVQRPSVGIRLPICPVPRIYPPLAPRRSEPGFRTGG